MNTLLATGHSQRKTRFDPRPFHLRITGGPSDIVTNYFLLEHRLFSVTIILVCFILFRHRRYIIGIPTKRLGSRVRLAHITGVACISSHIEVNIHVVCMETKPVVNGILPTVFRQMGAQLVEATRYKLEDRGFNSRRCHWKFSLI